MLKSEEHYGCKTITVQRKTLNLVKLDQSMNGGLMR